MVQEYDRGGWVEGPIMEAQAVLCLKGERLLSSLIVDIQCNGN